MDARKKAEQDVLSAADCWARGVLQNDRLLDLTEQNLFDAVMLLDKLLKRNGIDPSHFPPPPQIPHELNIKEQLPTVRYSEHSTIPSPVYGVPLVKFNKDTTIEIVTDSEDIF
jgi:hypothetical protein